MTARYFEMFLRDRLSKRARKAEKSQN